MSKALIAIFLICGFSFIFWSLIGLLRLVIESLMALIKRNKFKDIKNSNGFLNHDSQSQVAVCLPAHNEEAVIKDALQALKKIISPQHIYVVNDASSDRTSQLAKKEGCNVYDLYDNHGKARALETLLNGFDILARYKHVLFVDADTRLREDYLKNALLLFKDKQVAAVAGFARSQWKNNIFIAYRSRVWFMAQIFFRFGMSWKFTNVNMIVPGFASMYRSDVLKQIEIAKHGLVIEDFNMTFELQKKKLGRIAHHPNVTGFTQDPDNFKSYCHQLKRWNLGFWQTVKVNGVWPSAFWLNLLVYLVEFSSAAIQLLILPGLLSFALSAVVLSFLTPWVADVVPLAWLILKWFLVLVALDYILTVIVAIFQKRPALLMYGPLMLFFRWIDAYYLLSTLGPALQETSSGVWQPPQRWNPADESTHNPVGVD